MNIAIIPKSLLKPKLFEHLRRVQDGLEEICITDHGKPVAKVIAISADENEALRAMRGLVTKYERPMDPVDVNWEAQA